MQKPTTSRRSFIRQLALVAGGVAIPSSLREKVVAQAQPTNEEICQRKFALAVRESLHERPIGEVMIAVGVSFLGTRYVANALETPGDEHLVVNLQGLDCVTFVENTLTLSRCIKLGSHTFEDYRKQLQLIRYRDGVIDKYPSRLHYFSDWIDDNEKKSIVRNVSQEIGGAVFEKKLSFMSMHPAAYKQLANKVYLERIKETESVINTRQHYFAPKEQLANAQEKIESGDIIGLTTSLEGLDIAHTGIAIRANGVLKYLHAPLSKGEVQITEESLVDYLASHKTQTGLMVARPLEPVL